MLHELSFLVGTFSCVTRGESNTTWRFDSTNTGWGSWVIAQTHFAPQNGQPALYASTYVGYDQGAKRWNIVSLSKDGSYYTRMSSSKSLAGSHWKDGYPADATTAIIDADAKRYTFDASTPDEHGHIALSHTVCTRIT